MSENQLSRMLRSVWSVWGAFAVICLFYGTFAIAAGFELVETEKNRALPLPFQIHALAGGVALVAGILQFNSAIRARSIRTHRWGGRVYVCSACLASIAAVANAMFFDVSLAARLSFALLGVCWFAATVIAYKLIKNGNITLHREWVLRSFALAFFFVTFSFWVPVLGGNEQGKDTAYFVAVTMSWVPNLLIAEVWIRRTRGRVFYCK